MFTWLLLPLALALTLSVSGPVVTGHLDGLTSETCPVIGVIEGMQVAIEAFCVYPEAPSLFGWTARPGVGRLAFVLSIDPVTLAGTWVDSYSRSGVLVPQP